MTAGFGGNNKTRHPRDVSSKGAGKEEFFGSRGIGRIGADFWPVLKGQRGEFKPLYDSLYGGWNTLSLGMVIQSILAPGKDGPIPTVRSELMREALQEAEARVLIQDALLDDTLRAKLGPDLARRSQDVLDERTRVFRYMSEFWDDEATTFSVSPTIWVERAGKLYDMAGEVAHKLKSN